MLRAFALAAALFLLCTYFAAYVRKSDDWPAAPNASARASLRRKVNRRVYRTIARASASAASINGGGGGPATCETLVVDSTAKAIVHELLLGSKATKQKRVERGADHYYQICVRPGIVATISLDLSVSKGEAKIYVSSRDFYPSKERNELFSSSRSGSGMLTFDTDHWLLASDINTIFVSIAGAEGGAIYTLTMRASIAKHDSL